MKTLKTAAACAALMMTLAGPRRRLLLPEPLPRRWVSVSTERDA